MDVTGKFLNVYVLKSVIGKEGLHDINNDDKLTLGRPFVNSAAFSYLKMSKTLGRLFMD
jgi:hypothetical protein